MPRPRPRPLRPSLCYVGGLAPRQRRRVYEHGAHLDEPLPIERLAMLARVSPCHMIRAFRASLGLTASFIAGLPTRPATEFPPALLWRERQTKGL